MGAALPTLRMPAGCRAMRQVSVFRQQRETNEHCPAATVGLALRAACGRAAIPVQASPRTGIARAMRSRGPTPLRTARSAFRLQAARTALPTLGASTT
jgi:hypothetical protein